MYPTCISTCLVHLAALYRDLLAFLVGRTKLSQKTMAFHLNIIPGIHWDEEVKKNLRKVCEGYNFEILDDSNEESG